MIQILKDVIDDFEKANLLREKVLSLMLQKNYDIPDWINDYDDSDFDFDDFIKNPVAHINSFLNNVMYWEITSNLEDMTSKKIHIDLNINLETSLIEINATVDDKTVDMSKIIPEPLYIDDLLKEMNYVSIHELSQNTIKRTQALTNG